MFKKFEGSFDPVIDFGRKWANRLFYGSLVASLLIVMCFSQAEVHANPFFTAIYKFVSSIVPAVGRMYSVSHYPAYTGIIFALNWLLVPFYFVLTIMAYNFRNNEVIEPIMQRIAADKRWIKWLCIPYLLLFFLSDWGVIPGLGFYSMSLYKFVPNHGLFRAMDSFPITVAVMYWTMCFMEGMYYGLAVCVIGWYIRKRIAATHRVEHHN